MMKKPRLVAVSLLFVVGLSSCNLIGKRVDQNGGNSLCTSETTHLLANLHMLPSRGFMFGHHDDPVYGIGWDGDENRSDVKSVCGDYPAVMSFDLGHIELGSDKSLDNVSFERIRKEIIAQYNRGGMSSLSWHLDNPVTGRDSWDVSDTTVVASVLPNGVNHEKFNKWLDRVAVFMNSLQTETGTKVPVLFRPWHEHTGSWFWWGQDLCTTEQYKALWRMTYDHMQQRGVRNLLYAYSPGGSVKDSVAYLERYPGDDIIDLVGFDSYQFDRQKYMDEIEHALTILTQVGNAHNKPIAITETGFEALPDSTWWTKTLLPVISKYPISYVLVWRNARDRENHYYAPYPGQVSAGDFVEFYNDPRTLFADDMKQLYFNNDKK